MNIFGVNNLLQILILMTNVMVFDAQPHLLKPSNVTFTWYTEMGAALSWIGPSTHAPNITYTAEYRWGRKSTFKNMCDKVREQCCSFQKLPSSYGIYTFKVKTHLQGEESDWAENKIGVSAKRVGPPTVSMVLNGGVMELNITDPEYEIFNSNCFLVNNLVYNITYWRRAQKNEVWHKIVQKRTVKLSTSALPSEELCVKVQIMYSGVHFKGLGLPSAPVCALNSPASESKYALMGSLISLAVLSVLMLSWCVYKGQNFLHPYATLPQQLRQGPPGTSYDMPKVLPQAEEKYEHVILWEPLCERNNSVCMHEDMSAGDAFYSLSTASMSSETPLHSTAEPTNPSGMHGQSYYNILS